MKVGIIQLCSQLDFKINLTKIREFLSKAKEANCTHVFLPEVFYSMSDGTTPTPFLIEQGNEHYENIRSLSKDFGVYILGGSAATRVLDKVINRNYNFDPKGNELEHYDKINLFSCDLGNTNKRVINEADVYTSGNEEKILDLGEWKIGLSICFDVRFPRMYRNYVEKGANIFTISAAFTKVSGKAHWHTLCRSRAIENQCYVIAPAQWGDHNDKIKTFGHSLIIDPWGEILADAGEGEKLITAELSLERVNKVRKMIKIF